MTSIKQYTSVHPKNTSLSFDIKKMETIYQQRNGKADEPHRHDYYTILLTDIAAGKHLIDFHEFSLQGKQVYFISPDQVHQIIETQPSQGWVMTFSTQFIAENNIEKCFIEDLHLFQDFGYTPPLELDDEAFEKLAELAEQIALFVQSDKKFKYQAVGALLKLFLIHCNNACSISKEENTQSVQAAVVLIRHFKDLLEKHHKEWHKVNQYATHMHITADYLNTSIKSLTGKSAKEHIQSRLLVAAKRLLRFSNLSNKAIAYELGFSAPANFSQFFKRCTGMSPSQF